MPDYNSRYPDGLHRRFIPEETPVMRKPAAAPQPVDPALLPQRRPIFTAVRWGAVLAGVAVGLSMQLVITLLGIAAGLTAGDVVGRERFGIGPLLWAALSMLVAAFAGGYVAARMSGLKRTADGILHGAVSWAVTTILFAVLATSIGGALVGGAMAGGVFTSMAQLAQAQEQVAQGEGPVATFMRQQVDEMDVISLSLFRQYIRSGEREAAVSLLIETTSLEPGRAEAVVDQALILSGAPEAASPGVRKNTEVAVQGAGLAAWIVFGAVALGLALGMAGGRLGVAGARRVNWSDRQGEPPPEEDANR
ncbi:MAG TPA: hypothetical protein VM406_03665 [Noviherbaspirillum sp.]|nr:hypothetical protein [Noviherbaspirillum sp.]